MRVRTDIWSAFFVRFNDGANAVGPLHRIGYPGTFIIKSCRWQVSLFDNFLFQFNPLINGLNICQFHCSIKSAIAPEPI